MKKTIVTIAIALISLTAAAQFAAPKPKKVQPITSRDTIVDGRKATIDSKGHILYLQGAVHTQSGTFAPVGKYKQHHHKKDTI